MKVPVPAATALKIAACTLCWGSCTPVLPAIQSADHGPPQNLRLPPPRPRAHLRLGPSAERRAVQPPVPHRAGLARTHPGPHHELRVVLHAADDGGRRSAV